MLRCRRCRIFISRRDIDVVGAAGWSPAKALVPGTVPELALPGRTTDRLLQAGRQVERGPALGQASALDGVAVGVVTEDDAAGQPDGMRLAVSVVAAACLGGDVVVAADAGLARDVAGGIESHRQDWHAVQGRGLHPVQGIRREDLGQRLVQVLALGQVADRVPLVGQILAVGAAADPALDTGQLVGPGLVTVGDTGATALERLGQRRGVVVSRVERPGRPVGSVISPI